MAVSTLVGLAISEQHDAQTLLTGTVSFALADGIFEMTLLDDTEETAELIAEDVKQCVKALLRDPQQQDSLRALLEKRAQRA